MWWFFLITSIIIVGLQFFNQWFISEGLMHRVYPISCVIYVLYATVETTLGLTNPEQSGILIFNLVNIWGFAMAVKGWRRVRKNKEL